jgi:hypothetical protein
MILPQSPLSRLTLAALGTLLGVQAVQAEPVIDASSAAAVISGPATPSSWTYPGYINSSSNASDADGNAYGYAFANTSGAYAVNSSAEGKGNAQAHSQFAFRFENLSGIAQHYTLSFRIYGGYLDTYAYRDLLAGETMSVSYAASIKTQLGGVGGWTSVFSSSATLNRDANGSTLTRSGVALTGSDADVSDHSYSWSNDYYAVNLGVVGAGDFIDVLAELDNNAVADVGIYSFGGGECNGYGDGWDGYGGCYGNYFAGRASSFYGDPLEIDTDPLAFAVTAVPAPQDLPEPAGLALVGLAAGAAALARRRRSDA